mgnify:CR=1 FL=1
MCIRDRNYAGAKVDFQQALTLFPNFGGAKQNLEVCEKNLKPAAKTGTKPATCLLYTSDAADERSSVDLGGRRIIKKKKKETKKKNTKKTQHNTETTVSYNVTTMTNK